MKILKVKHALGFFVASASLFLTACTASVKNTASTTPAVYEDIITTAYVLKKQSVYRDATIASTNNVCVDGFNFLKGVNKPQHSQYTGNYSQINQNVAFLATNQEIIDKDSKELLAMAISKKMDTLCAKVQYAGFMGMKDKIEDMSGI